MQRHILTTAALGGLLAMAAVAVSQEAENFELADPALPTSAAEPPPADDRIETFQNQPASGTSSAAPSGFRPRAATTPRVSGGDPGYGTPAQISSWPVEYRLRSATGEHERKVRDLVRDWKAAGTEDVRSEAEENLRKALAEEFAARMAQHEQQVEELEARVRELREQLDRRREKQSEIIEFRFQELLREAQGLGWGGGEPVGAASNPFTRIEDPNTLPGPAQVLPIRSR